MRAIRSLGRESKRSGVERLWLARVIMSHFSEHFREFIMYEQLKIESFETLMVTPRGKHVL